MTPEELLNAYKDAYKKTAADPTLWSAINLKPRPKPAAPAAPGVSQALVGNAAPQMNGLKPMANPKAYINSPGVPSDFSHTATPAGRESDLDDKFRAMGQEVDAHMLGKHLENGVNMRAYDMYNPSNPPFNMSKDAMLRRMNTIYRQQAQDQRLRTAMNKPDPFDNSSSAQASRAATRAGEAVEALNGVTR